MKITLLKTLCATVFATLLLIGTIGCGRGQAADDAAHEHGPDTHTHETAAALADTAGTYVDTTAIDLDGDHEHGSETHTHDDDAPAHE